LIQTSETLRKSKRNEERERDVKDCVRNSCHRFPSFSIVSLSPSLSLSLFKTSHVRIYTDLHERYSPAERDRERERGRERGEEKEGKKRR
jgi:hypothetical protein